MLLLLKIVQNPQLRPHKIDVHITPIISDLPPKPPPHQLLDQRAIVPVTNPDLVLLVCLELLLTVHFTVDAVTPLEFEEELSVGLDTTFVDCVLVFVVYGFH